MTPLAHGLILTGTVLAILWALDNDRPGVRVALWLMAAGVALAFLEIINA